MNVVLSVSDIRKKYRIFKQPSHRVLEAIHPFGKSYHNDFWALKGVTFDLIAGESLGVIGCNGSGKSTLLEIISGISRPTQGNITTKGKISALLELGAGFNPEFTGRENVLLYGAVARCSESKMMSRIDEIKQFADIGDFFDLPVKTYSSGMYARLAFSTALSVKPDILIVDEILAVGDARFQEKCYHKLQDLKSNGVSFILVSHNSEEILKNCDAVLFLNNGVGTFYNDPIEGVARYHEVLFGKNTNKQSLQNSVATNITDAKSNNSNVPDEIVKLFELNSNFSKSMPYYNSNERRITGAGAKIIDFVLLADGKTDFTTFNGAEKVCIYLKVLFDESIELPVIGVGIASSDGFIISGINTFISGQILPKAIKGEIKLYKFEFTLNLNNGDYFINFGIEHILNGEKIMIDVRRAVVHIIVSNNNFCTGMFKTSFEMLDLSEDHPGIFDN